MPLPSDDTFFDDRRSEMSQFLSVFITVPSREVAEKIGRIIVEERLAACVNIIPEMRSIYRWHDNLESVTEIVLIAKSRTALFAMLEQRVKALHPYQCPCIVAWPIETGH
jgi:periplasmic divalent cation tolerance protein